MGSHTNRVRSRKVAIALALPPVVAVFRGIGGTFFILYLIEKTFEIPFAKKERYAAMALGVSLLIGMLVVWAKNHAELVEPYLLF